MLSYAYTHVCTSSVVLSLTAWWTAKPLCSRRWRRSRRPVRLAEPCGGREARRRYPHAAQKRTIGRKQAVNEEAERGRWARGRLRVPAGLCQMSRMVWATRGKRRERVDIIRTCARRGQRHPLGLDDWQPRQSLAVAFCVCILSCPAARLRQVEMTRMLVEVAVFSSLKFFGFMLKNPVRYWRQQQSTAHK